VANIDEMTAPMRLSKRGPAPAAPVCSGELTVQYSCGTTAKTTTGKDLAAINLSCP
jgi:hypothetical protein